MMRGDRFSELDHNIDWFIFGVTAALVVGVPLILYLDAGGEMVCAAFEFVTTYFGFAYIWAGMATLGFLL